MMLSVSSPLQSRSNTPHVSPLSSAVSSPYTSPAHTRKSTPEKKAWPRTYLATLPYRQVSEELACPTSAEVAAPLKDVLLNGNYFYYVVDILLAELTRDHSHGLPTGVNDNRALDNALCDYIDNLDRIQLHTHAVRRARNAQILALSHQTVTPGRYQEACQILETIRSAEHASMLGLQRQHAPADVRDIWGAADTLRVCATQRTLSAKQPLASALAAVDVVTRRQSLSTVTPLLAQAEKIWPDPACADHLMRAAQMLEEIANQRAGKLPLSPISRATTNALHLLRDTEKNEWPTYDEIGRVLHSFAVHNIRGSGPVVRLLADLRDIRSLRDHLADMQRSETEIAIRNLASVSSYTLELLQNGIADKLPNGISRRRLPFLRRASTARLNACKWLNNRRLLHDFLSSSVSAAFRLGKDMAESRLPRCARSLRQGMLILAARHFDTRLLELLHDEDMRDIGHYAAMYFWYTAMRNSRIDVETKWLITMDLYRVGKIPDADALYDAVGDGKLERSVWMIADRAQRDLTRGVQERFFLHGLG